MRRIKPIGNDSIDAGLVALRRALVTLKPDHAVAGRKASRRRVAAAIKKIQKAVDAQYPVMRAKGVPRKRLTRVLRIKRLERAGWKLYLNAGPVASFASAGVPVRCIPAVDGHRLRTDPLHGQGPRQVPGQHWYVPAWAHAIGYQSQALLRKALKSTQRKQAALAYAALIK